MSWECQVLYDHQTAFNLGKFVVSKQDTMATVTIVAVGACVRQAIAASELLLASSVHATVIDLFSVNPLDVENLKYHARKTNNRMLVVEEHLEEGGC